MFTAGYFSYFGYLALTKKPGFPFTSPYQFLPRRLENGVSKYAGYCNSFVRFCTLNEERSVTLLYQVGRCRRTKLNYTWKFLADGGLFLTESNCFASLSYSLEYPLLFCIISSATLL